MASSDTASERPQRSKPKHSRPNYNFIHRNLLPVEVHPLPVLIPHNPLSLIAIALSYFVQILAPPLQPTYNGYFSSATSSIHITDAETTRKLWEMGFFGRGSLSRSEPTWLDAQKRKGFTAEENTDSRRNVRKHLKLERARKEQEEIDKELRLDTTFNVLKTNSSDIDGIVSVMESGSGTATPDITDLNPNGSITGFDEWKRAIEANGVPTPPPTSVASETSLAESRPVKRLQRQKTVRFSPTIEAREFDLSSPVISPIKNPGSTAMIESEPQAPAPMENQEHLNLSLEEAFFLSYGLGVLKVVSDGSDTVLPPASLLALFRRHSYSPLKTLSVPAEPDDPFMLSYVAYHHYRSLGWIVRSGVKFSVDFLLYNRGPAFSHAEFAICVLPSYTHPYWFETEESKKRVEEKQKRPWWWLHGVNRVQAQVYKHLVLCYVDIPAPLNTEEKGKDVDIAKLFSRYRVRDINIKRWTPNRGRD